MGVRYLICLCGEGENLGESRGIANRAQSQTILVIIGRKIGCSVIITTVAILEIIFLGIPFDGSVNLIVVSDSRSWDPIVNNLFRLLVKLRAYDTGCERLASNGAIVKSKYLYI